MFGAIKKFISRDVIIKTFLADLADTKSASIFVQKMVAKGVLDDMSAAIQNPSIEFRRNLLLQASNQRKSLGGAPLSQDPIYNQASLREAFIYADLSDDQQIKNGVMPPLLNWLKEIQPLLDADEKARNQPQKIIPPKAPKKVLIGNYGCFNCGEQDLAEKFLASDAGDNWRKCHKCGGHFQVQ